MPAKRIVRQADLKKVQHLLRLGYTVAYASAAVNVPHETVAAIQAQVVPYKNGPTEPGEVQWVKDHLHVYTPAEMVELLNRSPMTVKSLREHCRNLLWASKIVSKPKPVKTVKPKPVKPKKVKLKKVKPPKPPKPPKLPKPTKIVLPRDVRISKPIPDKPKEFVRPPSEYSGNCYHNLLKRLGCESSI